jgi:hypothetical protein
MSRRNATESPQARGHRTKRLQRGEEAPPPRLRRIGAPSGPQRAGRSAKESLLRVFEKIGGEAAMAKWARKNPTEFYRLWARLLPRDDEGPMTVIGVEDLLRKLADSEPEQAESLRQCERIGADLGLPRPSADLA